MTEPRKSYTNEDVIGSIEAMLAHESDAEIRARLLVLYRIASILADTSHSSDNATKEVALLKQAFEIHEKDQEKTSNRIIGAGKAFAIIFIVVQGFLGYIGTKFVEQHQENTVAISRLIEKVQKIETNIFVNGQPKP